MHEIVIVTMETLGMLLVSAGVGCVAAWWLGTAGLFLGSGVVLLGFAALVALRQQAIVRAAARDAGGRR